LRAGSKETVPESDRVALIRNVRKPFEMNLRKGDDRVLILADTKTDPTIKEAAVAAISELGVKPFVVVEQVSPIHVHEPGRATLAAMLKADVIVSLVSGALHYSNAMQVVWRETKSRCRLILMDQGLNVEMLVSGAGDGDYDEIQAIGERVHGVWQRGKRVRLSSGVEAELIGSIQNDETWLTAGRCVRMGTWNFCGFPDGESGAYLREGSAEGSVEYDASMQQPIGLLRQPILARVENGVMRDLQGGMDADRLTAYFRENSVGPVRLKEISIGLNEKAVVTGLMRSDKKIKGAVHASLEGKTKEGGKLRMDGVILKPTVEIDGREVVSEGEILV
jgi:aminopeptidase